MDQVTQWAVDEFKKLMPGMLEDDELQMMFLGLCEGPQANI